MEPDIYALSKAGFSEERIEEIISTCQARDCQSIAYLPIENVQLLLMAKDLIIKILDNQIKRLYTLKIKYK